MKETALGKNIPEILPQRRLSGRDDFQNAFTGGPIFDNLHPRHW